jgi:hypothetical protein
VSASGSVVVEDELELVEVEELVDVVVEVEVLVDDEVVDEVLVVEELVLVVDEVEVLVVAPGSVVDVVRDDEVDVDDVELVLVEEDVDDEVELVVDEVVDVEVVVGGGVYSTISSGRVPSSEFSRVLNRFVTLFCDSFAIRIQP